MKIFAKNFRGFRYIEADLAKVNFLVGDNSCGKSSLIYLIEAVTRSDLNRAPVLNSDFAVDEYDYFSPYFDHDDVTFGFVAPSKSKFAKLLTVKRDSHGEAQVIKSTFIFDGNGVTFVRNKNKTRRRNFKIKSWLPTDIIAQHEVDARFTEVSLEPRVSISEAVSVYMTSSKAMESQDRALFRAALESIIPGSRITSPLRAMPEKFYDFSRRVNAHGRHFAALWFDFVDSHDDDFKIDDLQKFGRDSGLFDDIKVSKIAEEVENSPLVVTVERGGKNFLLHQVGIGVSQIVPILIETIFAIASDNQHLLMQQPELHLHPVAQAELGSYLAKCCSKGMRPVVETHSSYMIDRFRSEIRDQYRDQSSDKSNAYDMRIIFCERSLEGNSATYIDVNQDGELVDPPESYHKFFVEELVRTLF